MESMGPISIEAGSSVTAIDLTRGLRDDLVLATGHPGGAATMWYYDMQGPPYWNQAATVTASHHDWEKVNYISASTDGELLMAATDDNVALWRMRRGDGGSRPVELKTLHGASSFVSAVAVGTLEQYPKPGKHLAVIAFVNGQIEGWGAGLFGKKAAEAVHEAVQPGDDDEKAMLLWELPRRGEARAIALAVSWFGVAAATSDGELLFWPQNLEKPGALLSATPLWRARPDRNTGSSAATALAMLAPDAPRQGEEPERSAWVVVAIGGDAVTYDGSTGEEMYRTAYRGDALAFSW